jgi:D-beta-D-heptose 7-phosphate kinase/D-beta-D-heptose 1-phosphate adenosyltransferase
MSDHTQYLKRIPWYGKRTCVVAIGDLILDEYLDGAVVRISPEAPVPVHHVKTQSFKAGGAANTALNIKFAGGVPNLFGVCGVDDGAETLKQILSHDGIECSGILGDPSRPTVRKCRVYSDDQQLLRIDWETIQPLSIALQDQLLARLEQQPFDALLLSDYAKGTLHPNFVQRALLIAQKKKAPVIIDPKGRDYQPYRGATLITPNYKEACEALGVDQFAEIPGEILARDLCDRFAFENVLVTMGAKGMVLMGRQRREPIFQPARAREVFDVTGAGDTVAALMALGLGAGGSFEQVMEIANLAAGVVVEKKGVHHIRLSEICEAMHRELQENQDQSQVASGPANSRAQSRNVIREPETKLIPSAKLAKLLAEHKAAGEKIVFTNGCFDILHAGHVTYLHKARELGQVLVVGVNDDASIRRLKGPQRPINPLGDRMTVLGSLASVDYVVPFSEDTPLTLIEALRPDFLVKGDDWAVDEIIGAKEVKSWGGEVRTIPLVPGRSTTKVVEKLQKS